ncbi:membrane progesterone receptor epsilon-like [Thalassophryne amazonica]|uniref:membrane progesterone receptor epsilon-like n=1 Tax=Thalassophryne amazonica TaxID=390379 RepID=UPI001471AA82|nr:membrane progesterone receptor epsilon-like [Thalassophryne amazonica]
MLLRCGQTSLPLLRHTDVPPRVIENFILSGYRFPNYSLLDCLLSAFRPTNETGNFWTHFLPVFVFSYYFVEVFGWDGAPHGHQPFFYPLWTYFVGVFCLLMARSIAHLLNSMSLVAREVCFFVDYGTISTYTVGSSLAYYHYIHPQPVLTQPPGVHNGSLTSRDPRPAGPLPPHYATPKLAMFFQTFYIPCSCTVAIICVLSCCNTRQTWRQHRYLIRTLVFLLPFLVSSTPVFYRLLTESPYSSPSSSFAVSTSMPDLFYRHCLWLLLSALNITKVPERLAPGRFDIWGHSHQWFHCCTFLSILDELHMIQAEVRAILLCPARPLSPAHLPGPTAASTYGVMFLLQTTIVSIIAWFSWRANQIYRPQQDKLAKEHPKKCH